MPLTVKWLSGRLSGAAAAALFAAAAAVLGWCKVNRLSGAAAAALRFRSKENLSLFFRSRVSTAAGGNLLAFLASRFLVEHRDLQRYSEEVMLVIAQATVITIAAAHRHVK